MTATEFKQSQIRMGLNNRQTAEALGVTIQYVDMLRAGTRTPSKTITLLIDAITQAKG
jgi:hypothetical protein